MTNTLPKLLTAVAASAFLIATPASAQTKVYPPQDLDDRVTPSHRSAMVDTFRGVTKPRAEDAEVDTSFGARVPESVETHPVPDEILEVAPDMMGYEYFTRPDGSIVFVYPEDRTVGMVLE